MEMESFIKHNPGGMNQRAVLSAIIIITIISGITFGQGKSEKKFEDKKKTAKAIVAPKSRIEYRNFAGKVIMVAPTLDASDDDFSEKSIGVDPRVYITLCVIRGNVKVNGWDRDEVRAFVERGSNVDFTVREKVRESAKPKWIEVIGKDVDERFERSTWSNSNSPSPGVKVAVVGSGCLSGAAIELDVPRGAAVKIRSEISETSVDSVRWADVANGGGSIELVRVDNGVTAQTYRGNVTVRESGGKMEISTTAGDIVAYKTQSNEIGDYFLAKTQSGAITLQSVGQGEVKVNSVSGTINFVGPLSDYGKYSFGSGYGTINLGIPARTSCRIDASYGGRFTSELPVEDIRKSKFDPIYSLTGRIGDGTCTLNFKTFSGSIRIKKLIDEVPVIADNDLLFDQVFPRYQFELN